MLRDFYDEKEILLAIEKGHTFVLKDIINENLDEYDTFYTANNPNYQKINQELLNTLKLKNILYYLFFHKIEEKLTQEQLDNLENVQTEELKKIIKKNLKKELNNLFQVNIDKIIKEKNYTSKKELINILSKLNNIENDLFKKMEYFIKNKSQIKNMSLESVKLIKDYTIENKINSLLQIINN